MFKIVSRLGRWMVNYLREAKIHPGNNSPSNNRSDRTTTTVARNLECPICLQPVDISVASYCINKPCNAHYHRHCIEQWKEHNQGNLTCTLCTLKTICLKPRKNKRNRNRRGSNTRTIMIQPADAPVRRPDAPARRPDAPAWRRNVSDTTTTTVRRHNASARRPDAPVRRHNAPAWRPDAPDTTVRRSRRNAQHVDIPPLRRERAVATNSRHSIAGDRALIRRHVTGREQRSMIDRVLNNSPLNDQSYNRHLHDSITINRHRNRNREREREQIIAPSDDLPYIYELNNRANRERDLARHRIRHRYHLNTSQTSPLLV